MRPKALWLPGAAQSDRLIDAVDYQTAYQVIKKEMEKKSHLLEHVANRILNSLYLELPEIITASVKVSKMNPPLGGQVERVSVELER